MTVTSVKQGVLRKPPEAIFIVPRDGKKLSLATRKTYNVLLHVAQQTGDSEQYVVELSRVLRGLAFNSHDYDLIKQYLAKLQGTQVTWDAFSKDGKVAWGVSSLLAEAVLLDGLIFFSIAPSLRSALLSPSMYASMQLEIQNRFRSEPALVLWETCGRYRTAPGGVTIKRTWQEWRDVLCAGECTTYTEFKYFGRLLKRAIVEVNEASDIFIELLVSKSGRLVTQLQFKVSEKTQDVHLSPMGTDGADPNLSNKIRSLGISFETITQWNAEYHHDRLRQTYEYVSKRLRNPRLPKLENPAAYFTYSLKNDVTDGNEVEPKLNVRQQQVEDKKAADVQEVRERLNKTDEARKFFASLDLFDQQTFLDRFKDAIGDSNKALLQMLRKQGLESRAVAGAFYSWLSGEIAHPSL